MTDTVSGSGQALTIPPGHAYTAESLRSYADRVAPGWHVAHKPEGAGSFGRRIDATAQSLDQLYVILDARPVPTYLPGEKLDPLLELRQTRACCGRWLSKFLPYGRSSAVCLGPSATTKMTSRVL